MSEETPLENGSLPTPSSRNLSVGLTVLFLTFSERAEAVKLAREIGNRAAADRLDINIDTLYNWLSKDKKHEEQTRPKPSQTELEHELEQLRKALAEKETELEILQDALGFFVSSRKKSQNHKG